VRVEDTLTFMPETQSQIALLKKLTYSFHDSQLLDEALTHRSVSARNNERLEFLGDGILNFVIAHELFKLFPDVNEGDLSRLRANLVNKDTLAQIAIELQLGDVIKLGSGELKSGGFRRPSILADTVESLLGAVYCDSNFETCRDLIIRLYKNRLSRHTDLNSLKDAKTQLQELLQSRRYALPVYSVQKITGKAHAQVFHINCEIRTLDLNVKGEGKSRRKAEQVAAEKAIEKVKQIFSHIVDKKND